MAKSMARIKDGIVINIEWCSDDAAETETLKNAEGRAIEMGDTYSDGRFYRNGNIIMSTAEKLADAERALAILLGSDEKSVILEVTENDIH